MAQNQTKHIKISVNNSNINRLIVIYEISTQYTKRSQKPKFVSLHINVSKQYFRIETGKSINLQYLFLV